MGKEVCIVSVRLLGLSRVGLERGLQLSVEFMVNDYAIFEGDNFDQGWWFELVGS